MDANSGEHRIDGCPPLFVLRRLPAPEGSHGKSEIFRSFRVGIAPLRRPRRLRTPVTDDAVEVGEQMVVDLRFSTDVATVSIAGDVDIAGWSQLDQVVAAAAAAAAHVIVFDVADVTFAGSTLLHVVAHAHEQMGRAGGSVTIRRPSKQVRRLLAVGGLPSSVSIVG